MLRFRPKVSYFWFPTHVEADADFKYKTDDQGNVEMVPGRNLIKYQIIKEVHEADFTKYHCCIFEGEYPFKV